MAELLRDLNQDEQAGRIKVRPWRELAAYASILMELSWVALWSRVLLRSSSTASYAEMLAVLGGVLLLAYGAAWVGERLSLRLAIRRGLMGALVILSVLAGLELLLENYGAWTISEVLARPMRTFADMANFLPVEFVLMVILLLLVWRGVNLVGRHIEPVIVIGGFRTGVLMFFAYGLLVPLNDNTPLAALDIFLFSGLLAMSAARIAVLSLLRGGQAIPFSRQWVGGIVLVVGCMVGLAVAVAGIMQGEGFILLSRLVAAVVYILALVLSPLVWLMMRLFYWIGEFLRFEELFRVLMELLNRVQTIIESLIAAIGGWMSKLDVSGVREFISYIALSKPLVLWGTILFLLVIILLTVGKHSWRTGNEPDEQEMESLLNQKNLFDLLREALRRGLEKMRDELEKMAGLRQARRLFAAARIRRIYARLMDLSTRLNTPRPESRTPLEFIPSLKQLFPGMTGELELITNAYLGVRYGELPEINEEVEKVVHAWRRVSHEGQEQLKARRKNRN
jgi:hypothetical protein